MEHAMPTIEYISGTVTTNLNNSSPFRLVNSDDLFNFASVRRLKERGPSQHGHTDLGGRLDAPTITLQLDFHASGGSALDGYRDTLRRTFPANPGSPSYLRYTRDDGEVRQIDVYRVGPVGIPADVGQRAAKLHRAVVQVEAPGATWYDPTQAAGTISDLSDWWRAYNTIGSANVLEHVENPTQGQPWTDFGTVAGTGNWTIALRSGRQVPDSGDHYAFSASSQNGTFGQVFGIVNASFGGTTVYGVYIGGDVERITGSAIMPTSGTYNYFLVKSGTVLTFYRDTTLVGTMLANTGVFGSTPFGLRGSASYWRAANAGTTSPWVPAMPRAAVYNIAPSESQFAALNDAMTTGGTAFTSSITYRGDWLEYPVVTLYGPLSDPVLTNAATGERLDFTGHTIGSGDYYTIDTRYGYKTVRNSGGDNKIGELTSDSDLETFHLAPDQEAAGGVNVISFGGTATGATTRAVITYYNRYTGP